MGELAILAIVADFPELRQALIQRRRALGHSQSLVDDIAGLAGGYTGKLECGLKNYGPVSLGPILGALGLELALVKASSCENGKTEADVTSKSMRKNYFSERARLAGRMYRAKFTDEEWSKRCTKANLTRWARVRVRRRAQAAAEQKIRQAKIKRKVKEPT